MKRVDLAASEIIGGLILILVFVGLFIVISTILLSQPKPELMPAAEFKLSYDHQNVIISIKRGDSFRVLGEEGVVKTGYVKVDGKKWPITTRGLPGTNETFGLVNLSSGNNSDFFSVGDELVGMYSGTKPTQVQFVYTPSKWRRIPSLGRKGEKKRKGVSGFG